MSHMLRSQGFPVPHAYWHTEADASKLEPFCRRPWLRAEFARASSQQAQLPCTHKHRHTVEASRSQGFRRLSSASGLRQAARLVASDSQHWVGGWGTLISAEPV